MNGIFFAIGMMVGTAAIMFAALRLHRHVRIWSDIVKKTHQRIDGIENKINTIGEMLNSKAWRHHFPDEYGEQ